MGRGVSQLRRTATSTHIGPASPVMQLWLPSLVSSHMSNFYIPIDWDNRRRSTVHKRPPTRTYGRCVRLLQPRSIDDEQSRKTSTWRTQVVKSRDVVYDVVV